MDDPLATFQYGQRLGPQQAVGIGNHADAHEDSLGSNESCGSCELTGRAEKTDNKKPALGGLFVSFEWF